MKVGYTLLNPYRPGSTSTAYLDRQEGEFWFGYDKYTDDPVKVYWNDDDEVRAWIEVA